MQKATRHTPSGRLSGFSLLEVIIALAITAVILATVYGAVRLAYRAQERGEAHMEKSQEIRTLVDRLIPVIHSAYPFWKKTEDGDRALFFKGESDSIGFVTTDVDLYRDDVANLPGLKWVRFFVDREGLNMAEDYFFNEEVLEEEDEGEVYLISPNVSDVEFEYYEVEEDSSEGDWRDDWDFDEDEKFELPRAVRISLTLRDDEEEIRLPPFVVRIYAYMPLGATTRKVNRTVNRAVNRVKN